MTYAPADLFKHDTVSLDDDNSRLVVIDQTLLPDRLAILELGSQTEIWEAINRLRVRGAPAIGVAAAFAVYLAAKSFNTSNYDEFHNKFRQAKEYLNSARPTAVNLLWALQRMEQKLDSLRDRPVKDILPLLRQEAITIKDEDIKACRAIGEHGLKLLQPGDGLLTHCNAGRLATIKYGTATAPMYLGFERAFNFKIFVDETRPLLQGARLTAGELMAAGLDVTLICDSMAASIMQKGLVQAVLVGCDRVAANGDAANKIGTLPLAICARHFNVPVYFCAPTSSLDLNCASGRDINIEERESEEITSMWYQHPMAPKGCHTFNPAFDVTPHNLITAFITEYGPAYPPFRQSLAAIMARKKASACKEAAS